MKTSFQTIFTATLALLHPFTQAQTPPSYEPSTPNTLLVKYNEKSQIFVPGFPLGTSDTQRLPTLSLPRTTRASHTSLYMAFMIDPDKLDPTNSTHPFSSTLQWYQPDLRLSRSTNTLSVIAQSTHLAAPYGGPAPPAGQIHRYVFLLFQQPDGYVLPPEFEKHMKPVVSARYFWNMTEFVRLARGVGEPVAGNWFSVSGGVDPRERGVEGWWKEWL